jgi:hypothetical protein
MVSGIIMYVSAVGPARKANKPKRTRYSIDTSSP